MIEGLRAHPWFWQERRADPIGTQYIVDCKKCMQHNPDIVRQSMGCGWLPPLRSTNVALNVPQPDGFKVRDGLAALKICPGYTVKLPQVVEIVRARKHWEKGTLREYFQGIEPHEHALIALEVLDGETVDLQSAMSTPRKDGGLGK